EKWHHGLRRRRGRRDAEAREGQGDRQARTAHAGRVRSHRRWGARGEELARRRRGSLVNSPWSIAVHSLWTIDYGLRATRAAPRIHAPSAPSAPHPPVSTTSSGS